MSPVSLQSENSSDSVAEEYDLCLSDRSFSSVAEVKATVASSSSLVLCRRWSGFDDLPLEAMMTVRAVSDSPPNRKQIQTIVDSKPEQGTDVGSQKWPESVRVCWIRWMPTVMDKARGRIKSRVLAKL